MIEVTRLDHEGHEHLQGHYVAFNEVAPLLSELAEHRATAIPDEKYSALVRDYHAARAQAERLREALTAFVCNSSVQVNFPSECEEAEAALAETASPQEVSGE